MLTRVMEVLSRLVERRIVSAAHKVVLFLEDIKWCGKLILDSGIEYDPERWQGLTDARRPQASSEVQYFVCGKLGWDLSTH